MKWLDSQGREACDVEFEGSGVDKFISKATYLDDGSPVPEEELDFMADGECLCGDCLESSWIAKPREDSGGV